MPTRSLLAIFIGVLMLTMGCSSDEGTDPGDELTTALTEAEPSIEIVTDNQTTGFWREYYLTSEWQWRQRQKPTKNRPPLFSTILSTPYSEFWCGSACRYWVI